MTELLFIQALKGEKTKTIPFWFMRQAGRYLPEYRQVRSGFSNFLEFCYTPKAACEVTLQPIRRFDMDAAILFCDILVIPDALGQDVAFQKGEGPVLKPIESSSDITKLKLDKVMDHLSPVMESVDLIRSSLDDSKALIGFAGSPWTVACYMVEGKGSKEFALTRQFAYEHREAFSQLMDLLVEATSQYLKAQIKAGANAVQLFDSWSGLIPEQEFEAWVINPTKRIVDAIKQDYPDIPVIGFAKSAGANLIRYKNETGVDALGIDTAVPLVWAKENLAGKTLQGNLDPLALFAPKETVIEATNHILESWKEIPFVFNLGHGFLPQTPIENVESVCETIKGFSR